MTRTPPGMTSKWKRKPPSSPSTDQPPDSTFQGRAAIQGSTSLPPPKARSAARASASVMAAPAGRPAPATPARRAAGRPLGELGLRGVALALQPVGPFPLSGQLALQG